ncbi:MAG: hypothetical protein NC184_02770 [Roseburia sp.]|nr:hypothetical protein [Roseburia sp.]
MTIQEAENIYNQDVANYIEQHEKACKKQSRIYIIIGAVLLLISLILIIIGFANKSDSIGIIFAKVYGIGTIPIGLVFVLLLPKLIQKSIKKGPTSFLPQIKNLYFNYLKCEDMSKDEKDFYKEKLEDIRNMELVNAVHRASAAASTAIMFSTLKK